MQLKNELHNVSMRTQTLTQYLTQIKTIVDNLAAADVQIDPEDVILYTLNGLPAQFQSFKTFIRNQLTPLSLDDFYSLLCSEEINLTKESQATTLLTDSNNTALYANRGRGRYSSQRTGGRGNFSAGRRNSSSQSAPRSSSIHCQICLKPGHTAMQCWHRLNANYIPTTNTPPTALTAAAADPSNNWIVDSGATTHLTNTYDYLHHPQPYQGAEQINMGNGSSTSIQHTGHGLLPTPQCKLYLHNLLHSPNLTHNLLSVSKLTSHNNCYLIFTNHGFCIKDRKNHKVLLQGPCTQGLYRLPLPNSAPTFTLSATVSANPWHKRLDHPHHQTLATIANHLLLPAQFSSLCTFNTSFMVQKWDLDF